MTVARLLLRLAIAFGIASMSIGVVAGIVTFPMFQAISAGTSGVPLSHPLDGEFRAFTWLALLAIALEIVGAAVLYSQARDMPRTSETAAISSVIRRLVVLTPILGAMMFFALFLIASYTVADPSGG